MRLTSFFIPMTFCATAALSACVSEGDPIQGGPLFPPSNMDDDPVLDGGTSPGDAGAPDAEGGSDAPNDGGQGDAGNSDDLDAAWGEPDASPDGLDANVGEPDASDETDAGNVDAQAPDAGQGEEDAGEDPVIPPLPTGERYANDWIWVATPSAVCRDGSPAGYYYRTGTSKNLMIFLNGGGACADKFFCGLNPQNVNQDLPIEFLSHGTFDLLFGVRAQRQLAPEEGIFKRNAPSNPVRDWNMVYVPYCTGDIHSGTRRDVVVEGVPGTQQFVGYLNFGLFLESFGPSFQQAEKILLTGSSAGGFGSLFNADRTQEFFNKWGGKVTTVSDSGVPFRDPYMAACLQKRWRDYWGLNDILPEDCTECFNADGGGLVEGYGKYLFHDKYKDRMLGGFVSSLEDEIIRAFFAPGLNATAGQPDNCTLDPTANTIQEAVLGGGPYSGEKFHNGLRDVIENVVGRDTVGYYAVPNTPHMHLWRPRFYEKNGTSQTMAEWLKDILDEKPTKAGTL